MKKLFVFAAALGLFLCLPASAQNNDHRDNKRDNNASTDAKPADTQRGASDMKGRDRATMQGNTSNGHGATAARSPATRQKQPADTTTRNRFLPATGDTRPANRPATVNSRNSGWSGNAANNPVNRPAADRGRNNWSGNNAMRQPDVNSLRLNKQAARRFHGGSYNRPTGYQNRRWGYGERLPQAYFVRNYWITDFVSFGLFAPPSDLVWVRVGDDALLIDRYTGEIVQVDYGVFY